MTLTIDSGAWDLYFVSGGGQPEPIDYDAEYGIDGDTIVFHHSDGSNTYRWDFTSSSRRCPATAASPDRTPKAPSGTGAFGIRAHPG